MNYKKFYKESLKIDYDTKKYHIHHIDVNKRNNAINNLVLLPKRLHIQYHFYLGMIKAKTIKEIPSSLNCCNIDELNKDIKIFRKYLDISAAIAKLIKVRDDRILECNMFEETYFLYIR